MCFVSNVFDIIILGNGVNCVFVFVLILAMFQDQALTPAAGKGVAEKLSTHDMGTKGQDYRGRPGPGRECSDRKASR